MRFTVLFLFLMFGIQQFLFAQKGNIYTSGGLAIKGYDPVSYFMSSAPQKGVKAYSLKWADATWNFASQSNLNLFKANPEKYVPQYGGYCSWGMKNGYKAKTNPKNSWTIHNNKLYLNYSVEIKKSWLENKETYIKTADENWKKFQ